MPQTVRGFRAWFSVFTLTALLALTTEASRLRATPIPDVPSALLQSLIKESRPDWTMLYRDPAPTSFPSRAQNALTLGSLYCDELLASLAEDAQQVKNLTRDLVAVAKPLGLGTSSPQKDPQVERFDRSKSLGDCADRKDWEGLRKELEASQAAAEEMLRQHQDRNLAELVSLGAWLRAQQVLAWFLLQNYQPETAALLRESIQNHVLGLRNSDIGKRPQEDVTLARIQTRLPELETLLSEAQEGAALDTCKVLKILSAMLDSAPARKSATPNPCKLD